MSAATSAADERFLCEAIRLAADHMRAKEGGPFGAVIVYEGRVVGCGWNRVTSSNDPTAHAEVVAIREAAAALGTFQLTGCVLYASCEPCPMCLGAAYWARVDRIVFAASRQDAARAGFDDAFLYEEIGKPIQARRIPTQPCPRPEVHALFEEWRAMPDKTAY